MLIGFRLSDLDLGRDRSGAAAVAITCGQSLLGYSSAPLYDFRPSGNMTLKIENIWQAGVHLSEFMRLSPDDVILTGTPDGVAYNKSTPDYLRPGDVVRCGIEGLGEQRTEIAG